MMMIKNYLLTTTSLVLACILFSSVLSHSQVRTEGGSLDEKVARFLSRMKREWRDLNVPEEDGRILYETIIQNRYTKALEIGTSTGHSALWIAWALSKTGGKLITIEIDEERHREAVAHFKEAGLTQYIDARLADAHQLVKKLPGPFDFVFIDADKNWYVQYAKDLVQKVEPGGCIAAHNVVKPPADRSGGYWRGTEEYYLYVKALPGFETRIHPQSPAGLCLSYKRARE